MSRKMIFMLLSPVWGFTPGMKRNFGHLVQETRPQRVAKWFLNSKKSKRSLKIHEICQDLMISYVEAMVKNWEGFA